MVINRLKYAVLSLLLFMVACTEAESEPVFYIGDYDDDVSVTKQPDVIEGTEQDVGENDAVSKPPTPTTGLVDGEACVGHSECRGGTCLGGDDWTDGYCTTQNCETKDDCASDGEDNQCLQLHNGVNFCVRMCTRQRDCRSGYVCSRVGRGVAVCLSDDVPSVADQGLDNPDIELSCTAVENQQVTLEYDIAPDTVAYMVTPLSRRGRRLIPLGIQTPSGQVIDFGMENAFQAVPSQLFGSMNPTVVPATAAHAGQLESGRHTYHLRTDETEVCHYLLQENTLGTVMDLEIYLVDVDGMDASTATTNASMRGVIEHFEEIFLQAGVRVGNVNFHDVSEEDVQRFSVVRSERDVMNLVSLSKTPVDTLSMNIFFVKRFAFADGGGTIGISMGLPGPAGLHGSYGSGVVFTSEFMGTEFHDGRGMVSGDDFTGIVLAHEVGHYLGLFHTSEQYGQGHDPLPDTPECSQSKFPRNCPDLGNLMFPYADIRHTEVTEDQAWVIRVNPLTKE